MRGELLRDTGALVSLLDVARAHLQCSGPQDPDGASSRSGSPSVFFVSFLAKARVGPNRGAFILHGKGVYFVYLAVCGEVAERLKAAVC